MRPLHPITSTSIVFLATLFVAGIATPVAADICVAPPACPADLNGSGGVTSADLTVLLIAWGAVGPDGSPADFDGDGVVGCFDQILLEDNLGPCPQQRADLSGLEPGIPDGRVNILDMRYILANCEIDCRFDLTRNGKVDQADVDAFECLFGSQNPIADFNGDRYVNVADLPLLLTAVDLDPDCRVDLDGNGELGWSDIAILEEDWEK